MARLSLGLLIVGNALTLFTKNNIVSLELNKYNFDSSKPIKRGINHFFNEELIGVLKREILSEYSNAKQFVHGVHISVGTKAISHRSEVDLFLDFAQALTKADTIVELFENIDYVKNFNAFTNSIIHNKDCIVARRTHIKTKFYKDLD